MSTILELLLGGGLVAVSMISAVAAFFLARMWHSTAGVSTAKAVPAAAPPLPKETGQESPAEVEDAVVEGEAPAQLVEPEAAHEEHANHEGEHSKEEILAERKAIIERLERERASKVITMIHRKEPWTTEDEEPEIVLEDSETILGQIRNTPPDKPIDMILHTPGGVALAAEMIAMALKYHKGKVTVMVPFYAMSGGTLIALSADEIRMERYSILGPVDPQIEGMPAASLMSIVRRKQLDAVSDRTLVLAQVAEMQTQNAKDFVKWLLRDKMGDQAEKVAEFLAGGYLAHETPITLDVASVLGLNAVEGVPDLVYDLFKTCAFGAVTRPGQLTTETAGTSLQ